ncbi:uncharacterized protein EV422DRAFT_564262 [Fimicolochytrium jonesii]|uniref:uncharacterized protein n=1 Tax=Fimicolochytrium jonesii TaxID=1396493 RepID=UPI0022FE790C|nr:uncharacterized protein EV422DRAFT_564262 [Fimicolochytrium jonesii]KAI8824901.1 hypothetical protein EV422DRAFT_564262 [Fimicolochytrium jonesii]
MATIGADPELGLPVPGRAYPILRDYWPTPVTSVPEAQRDDAHISWTQPAAHKPPNHDSIASTALWSQKATSGPPQASPASLRNHFAASDNPRATALYYPTLKPNNHKHASQQITTPRESMDEQTRPDGKTIDLATPISRASTSTIKASEAAPKQKVPRPHRHSSLFSEVGGPGLFLQTADSELWQDSLESAEDPTTPPKAPPKLRSVAVTPQLPPINSPGSRLSLADFQPGHHRDYFGPDARVDMPNTSPRQIDGTLPRPLSLAASTASSVGMLVAMYYNTMDRPKETPETSPNREPTSSARICARYGHEPVFNDEIEVNEGDSMLIEQVFKDGARFCVIRATSNELVLRFLCIVSIDSLGEVDVRRSEDSTSVKFITGAYGLPAAKAPRISRKHRVYPEPIANNYLPLTGQSAIPSPMASVLPIQAPVPPLPAPSANDVPGGNRWRAGGEAPPAPHGNGDKGTPLRRRHGHDAHPPKSRYRRVVTAGTSVSNIWRYSIRETSRQKSQFCIGCCSVCLVVFAVAVLMSVMAITPVVFLGIAELTAGETDMTVWPDWPSGYTRLNYTLAQTVLSDKAMYTYSTPRVNNYNMAYYPSSKCIGWDVANAPQNTTFSYIGPDDSSADSGGTLASKASLRAACQADPKGCAQKVCSGGVSLSTWVIDSEKERLYGIGRTWTLPPVPQGGVYIGQRAARALGVGVGDFVLLSYDIFMFPSVYTIVKFATTAQGFQDITLVNTPLRVSAVFDEEASNKFPQWARTGYLAVLEYKWIIENVAPHLAPSYPPAFGDQLLAGSRNGAQYGEAHQIIFACDQPRFQCYLTSNFNKIAARIIKWGSAIKFRLGMDLVATSLDTLGSLKTVSTFSQFLSLITSIVVALFVGLSCFLIYNLLMVSVETRTFELGILRMIGQTRKGIVQMILIQAATYSVPAWAIGLILAQIAFGFGKRFLENIANIKISAFLTFSSIITATVLGIAVPAIAAILPIRQALSGNLRDSLDKRHSKVKPVVITIERSGPGSLQSIIPSALTGAVLASLGFAIYYLVPKALVDSNYGMLFNIFMALLLGMLFGLVMLSFNMQPMAERFLLSLLLMVVFFENAAVHSLVAQNLVAHRMRNRKTSAMFAFALAFIIFLSVNLSVELNGMEYDKMLAIGAEIKVRTGDDYNGIKPEYSAAIEDVLTRNKPFVVDWAYASSSIRSFDSAVQNTQVANLGRIAAFNIEVIAVSPNWFNMPKPSPFIYIVDEANPVLSAEYPSVSEQLYSPEGFRSAAISTILRTNLAVQQLSKSHTNFSDAFLLKTTVNGQTKAEIEYKVLHPAAFLDSAPMAIMTKFPTSRRTTAIVSFPTMVDLTNGRRTSVDEIPINSIQIALNTSDPAYPRLSASLVDALNAIVRSDASVTSLYKEQESIKSSRRLLSTIFNLATLLVMLITLFSLNGCMYTNITEQAKELGVLRALGVTKWGIFRVYAYEAFILTSTAGMLGALIGAAIGWSMAAQRAIMTQTPVGFPFPWDITLVAIVTSVVSSFISTTGPVYGLVAKRRIVSILRD